MNTTNISSQCPDLESLSGLLENLSPKIAPFRGKVFQKKGEKQQYRRNEIVHCFLELYNKTTPEKRSPELSGKIIRQIRDLDTAAQTKLQKKSLFIRILAFARTFFENLFSQSEKKLTEIEKSLKSAKPNPIPPRPPTPKKERRVRFNEGVEVLEFDEEDEQDIKREVTIAPIKDPESRPKEFERRYPPTAMVDTIVFTGGGIKSMHHNIEVFSDDEIQQAHKPISEKDIGQGVVASKTQKGRYVIQQQATRGCTAATAAMLIKDHDGQPDIRQLKTRNMGDNSHQIRDIKNAGFTPISTKITSGATELSDLLRKNGPAIVTLCDANTAGHVVIVDEISENDVRLRDPYHGWEVTVTRDAFLKKWFLGEEIIQIAEPLPHDEVAA